MKDMIEELWTYQGRRYDTKNGKLYDQWLCPDGESRLFAKLSGVVGGVYKIDVKYGDNNECNVDTHISYVGKTDNVSNDVSASWRAKDQTASASNRLRLLESSDKRSNEVDETLEGILKIAGRLKSWADKDALARYVTAKIHRT